MSDSLFHAHHSAFGAYGSFTLGCAHATGGFNVNDGRCPGKDNVYIGFARKGQPLRMLPFFATRGGSTDSFATNVGHRGGLEVATIPAEDVRRRYLWATDEFLYEGLSFALHTPFGPVADPRGEQGWLALAEAILPMVTARLTFDNRDADSPALVIFGLAGPDVGVAPIDCPSMVGAIRQGREGIAAHASSGAQVFAGFQLGGCFSESGAVREPQFLGPVFGLAFTVPPGEVLSVPIAIGWFIEGNCTHGIRSRYAYTEHFRGLDHVLNTALELAPAREQASHALDRQLAHSGLSEARQSLIAHATRSYFGSSQLLIREDTGDPLYVVNEGEYCMINTLDLAVDQVFFESRYFPWATREILDLSQSRYRFVDALRVPGSNALYEGGVSFCHDMGVRNQFSKPGTSSYELAGVDGCFSHMTFEQACNWPLLACTYVFATGDLRWAKSNELRLRECLESLERRDHPIESMRKGFPNTTSNRCGEGSEITTYDSLDPALSSARGSTYCAMKAWAAYLGLAQLFFELGDHDSVERAIRERSRIERAILESSRNQSQLPANLVDDHGSVILPTIEPLVFWRVWKTRESFAPGSEFLQVLREHLAAALATDNRLPSGGWRLSSTSEITWLSKVFLCQVVGEQLFDFPIDHGADDAHWSWQTGAARETAFTDQIAITLGGNKTEQPRAVGSKYYPRGVTSILFLPLTARGSS